MAIYIIGDLHLSFGTDKPMDIFGKNWENHAQKIKENWINKLNNEDTVIIPGDFSWATYLNETYNDFKFLNELPGKKILLKGNHDYWWTTIKSMNKYLKENNFENIYFLFNNSYLIEDKIIVGTRGWNNTSPQNAEDYKILKRELNRLELSIKDGIQKYGIDKEIIAFIHYPPYFKQEVPDEIDFLKLMRKYNIKKCFYGHLHGESYKDAVEGNIDEIELKLVSSDYLNFDLFIYKN
jgi:predicted phosphohydrolase